jgi:preprotein translocase SecE subunit
MLTYIKETFAEMRHVQWPSRSQAVSYTVLVVVITALVAVLLGAFDELFGYLVAQAIRVTGY